MSIELNNIGVAHSEDFQLDIDSLLIGEQGFTALIGLNGSGKSTLLRVAAGDIIPDHGEIRFNGQLLKKHSTRQLAAKRGFLPQQMPSAVGLHVSEAVHLGRYARHGVLGRQSQADVDAVNEAMLMCDVNQFSMQSVSSLSGGERQRVWLAMLMAQSAEILLLDEPISALDVGHQIEALNLLKAYVEQRKRSVVVVLHDINLACSFANRIVALESGRIAFDGTPEQLYENDTLSKLFQAEFTLVQNFHLNIPHAICIGKKLVNRVTVPGATPLEIK